MNHLCCLHSDIANLILCYLNGTHLAILGETCRHLYNVTVKIRSERKGPYNMANLIQDDNVYVLCRYHANDGDPMYVWTRENDTRIYHRFDFEGVSGDKLISIATSYNAYKSLRWFLCKYKPDAVAINIIVTTLWDNFKNEIPFDPMKLLYAVKEAQRYHVWIMSALMLRLLKCLHEEVTESQDYLINCFLNIEPISYEQFDGVGSKTQTPGFGSEASNISGKHRQHILANCSQKTILRMLEMTKEDRDAKHTRYDVYNEVMKVKALLNQRSDRVVPLDQIGSAGTFENTVLKYYIY